MIICDNLVCARVLVQETCGHGMTGGPPCMICLMKRREAKSCQLVVYSSGLHGRSHFRGCAPYYLRRVVIRMKGGCTDQTSTLAQAGIAPVIHAVDKAAESGGWLIIRGLHVCLPVLYAFQARLEEFSSPLISMYQFTPSLPVV